MTAEILRSVLLKRVDEIREKSIRALRQCKFTPATGTDKGVVQSSTCEEIALHANECNAWIEAMDGMRALIEHETVKILQPEQKGDVPKKKPKKDFYG